jgi:hypothetical protein
MFVAVNRPPGWSTRRLIMRALALMAFSMVLLGSMMTFGIYGGSILSAVVGAVSVLFVQSGRFSTRPDKLAMAVETGSFTTRP